MIFSEIYSAYYKTIAEILKAALSGKQTSGDLRKIVEKYIRYDLKSEVSDKAKKKVDSMNDVAQLKEKLNKLIEQSPEACLLLLDD